MAKRKMVQHNLVKNSIAAYFAAIEIHNKPSIAYRYETVTLLIMNAWELILKAFIKKYAKNPSIYEDNGHTIKFEKAIRYVGEYLNNKVPKSFVATSKNLSQIEKYRNNVAHYYNEQLTPYIFMLVARCAVNYVEFLKLHFGKDIIAHEELFIMPLGFKLPFRPEDFLSRKAVAYTSSKESKEFIESILSATAELKEQGIEESIVLGFDVYLESVKKVKNSDLLIAVTTPEEADAKFVKITQIQLSDNPNAQIYNMSDEQFRSIWKYRYSELIEWCRANVPGYKQGKRFYQLMRALKEDIKCVYRRRLDSNNPKSASQEFYTDYALDRLKSEYVEEEDKNGV